MKDDAVKHVNTQTYDRIREYLANSQFAYTDDIDKLCEDTIAVCNALIDDITKYQTKHMTSPLRRARRGTKIIRDLGKIFRRVSVDISK